MANHLPRRAIILILIIIAPNGLVIPDIDLVNLENPIFKSPLSEPIEMTWTNVSGQTGLWGSSGSFFAWGDFNDDGNPDLMVDGGAKIYENTGAPDYSFADVRIAKGLPSGHSVGVWGDLNRDGNLDLVLGGRSDSVYMNGGSTTNWTFTLDITRTTQISDGYPTTATVLRDVNQDGWLDLYMANGEDWNDGNPVYYEDHYFLGGPNGFTNATTQLLGDFSYARGVSFGDSDRDGDADLYVGNYRIVANRYYENQNGVLVGVSSQQGAETILEGQRRNLGGSDYWGHTIASAFADMDNDGFPEILSANLVHLYYDSSDSRGRICDDSHFYRQSPARGTPWQETRPDNGISYGPRGGSGVYQGDELYAGLAVADVDNDGDLDMWLPQIYNLNYATAELWINDGEMGFTNKAADWNLDVIDTYGGAFADYDSDGDMDLITGGRDGLDQTKGIHLFRNDGATESTNDGNWLELTIDYADNTSAIGTTVEIYRNQSFVQSRTIAGAEGPHSSSSSQKLHFGFGQDNSSVDVLVLSQNGSVNFFENISLNQAVTINFSSTVSISSSIGSSVGEIGEGIDFTVSIESNFHWQLDVGLDNIIDESGNSSQTEVTVQLPNSGKQILRLLTIDPISGQGKMQTISVNGIEMEPILNLSSPERTVISEEMLFSLGNSHDSSWDMQHMNYYFEWNNSWGSWSNRSEFAITIDQPGTYDFTYGLRDHRGNSNFSTIEVQVDALPPTPSISLNQSAIMDELVGLSIGNVVNDSGNIGIQYQINWGDGEVKGWTFNPFASHRWNLPGTFEVQVIAKNSWGLQSNVTTNITIDNPSPIISWIQLPSNLTIGENGMWKISVHDTQSDMDSLLIEWSLNGEPIVSSDPFIQIMSLDSVGTFQMAVVATDQRGQWSSISTQFVVRIDEIPIIAVELEGAIISEDGVYYSYQANPIFAIEFNIGEDWVLQTSEGIIQSSEGLFLSGDESLNYVEMVWYSENLNQTIIWQKNQINISIESNRFEFATICDDYELSLNNLPEQAEIKWMWQTADGYSFESISKSLLTSVPHQQQSIRVSVTLNGEQLFIDTSIQPGNNISLLNESELILPTKNQLGSCAVLYSIDGERVRDISQWEDGAAEGEYFLEARIITWWWEDFNLNYSLQVDNDEQGSKVSTVVDSSIQKQIIISTLFIIAITITAFAFIFKKRKK